MNTLKTLTSKSSLTAMAAGFATALAAVADTGTSFCSDAGGTKTCTSASGTACCIYGTDSTGAFYSTHDCCRADTTCMTRYTNGTVSYGGAINPGLTVLITGCL